MSKIRYYCGFAYEVLDHNEYGDEPVRLICNNQVYDCVGQLEEYIDWLIR